MERILGIVGLVASGMEGWLVWLVVQALWWALAASFVACWFRFWRPRSTSACHAIVASAMVICTLIGVVPKWGNGWLAFRHEPTIGYPSASHALSEEHSSLQSKGLLPQPLDRDKENSTESHRAEVQQTEVQHAEVGAPIASNGHPFDRASHSNESMRKTATGNRPVSVYFAWSILGLWGVGASFYAIRFVGSLRELIRWRKEAIGLPSSEQSEFAMLTKECNLRRKVVTGMRESVHVPMVLCGLPVMILVPHRWLEWCNESRRAAWLHELSHVQRYDDLWRLYSEVLRVLWWFHPGVRWLLARRELESEMLCDEAVVRAGCPPQRLAEMLLEASRKLLMERERCHMIAPCFFSQRTMRVRIERLIVQTMGTKPVERSSPWQWFASIVGIGLVTFFGSMRMIANDGGIESPASRIEVGDPTATDLAQNDDGNQSTLKARYVTIIGKLIDDETGKPIERASWEWGMKDPADPSRIAWGFSKQYGRDLPDGTFEQYVHFREDGDHDRLRVFAAGYEVTDVVDTLPMPFPKQWECVVRLKPLGKVHGILRDHQGKPLAQAKVLFIPEGHRSNIVEGMTGADPHRWPQPSSRDGAVAETWTDERGQFTLPANRRGALAASSPLVDLWTFPVPEQGEIADLRMPDPGKVVIDLRYGLTQELAKKGKEEISVDSESPNQCWLNITRDTWNEPHWKFCEYNRQLLVMQPSDSGILSKGVLRSDRKDSILEAGDNEFQNVLRQASIEVALPPGKYRIQRLRSAYQPIEEVLVTVASGAPTNVAWSRSAGRAVRGQIHLPQGFLFVRQEGEAPRKLDWSVPAYGKVTVSDGERLYDSVRVHDDGSFWIAEHLPAGKYKLNAEVHLPESDLRQMLSIPVLGPEDLSNVEVELTVDDQDVRLAKGAIQSIELTIPAPSNSVRVPPDASFDAKASVKSSDMRQRLVGRVLDHHGKPVQDAAIYFVPKGQKPFVADLLSESKPLMETITQCIPNQDGRFTMEASGPGTCVVARPTGDVQLFAIEDTGGEAMLQLSPPASVELRIDEWQFDQTDSQEKVLNVDLVVYRLDREGIWGNLEEFRRRVRFSTLEGASTLPGAQVVQVSQTHFESQQGKGKQTRTQAVLRFELPTGRYLIQRTSDAGPYDPGKPGPVACIAGSEAKIDWTTSRGAPVHGEIHVAKETEFVRSPGEPAQPFDWTLPNWAYVHVASEDGVLRAKGLIAKDGTFVLNTHLPPGKYRVRTWITMPANPNEPGSLVSLDPPEIEADAILDIPHAPSDPAEIKTIRLVMNAKMHGNRWTQGSPKK